MTRNFPWARIAFGPNDNAFQVTAARSAAGLALILTASGAHTRRSEYSTCLVPPAEKCIRHPWQSR